MPGVSPDLAEVQGATGLHADPWPGAVTGKRQKLLDGNGRSALYLASHQGHYGRMGVLLDKGVHVSLGQAEAGRMPCTWWLRGCRRPC